MNITEYLAGYGITISNKEELISLIGFCERIKNLSLVNAGLEGNLVGPTDRELIKNTKIGKDVPGEIRVGKHYGTVLNEIGLSVENGKLTGVVTDSVKKYFSGGMWLEVFVNNWLHEHAAACGITEVFGGVKIKYPKQTIENEIDVAFIKDETIFILECKSGTAQESGDFLYKIEAVRKSLGAIKTKVWFFAKSDIILQESAVNRADLYGIELIGEEDVKRIIRHFKDRELLDGYLADKKYSFELLDPVSDNKKFFEANKGKVYGVEVTIPELAGQCVSNIDPQHTGNDPTRAAIQEALVCALPPSGSVLATIRPDLDSLGAMAILVARSKNIPLEQKAVERINELARTDTFSRGPWPGPNDLPSEKAPWPNGYSAILPMGKLAADPGASLNFRVRAIREWILTGRVPERYQKDVNEQRKRLIEAINNNEFDIKVIGGMALVETTFREGTELAYCKAPVVLAKNPTFRFQGSKPHLKYTIAQYNLGYVDLAAVLKELVDLEPGWGGSPTIIGSPQGKGSILSMETVVSIVQKHLKGDANARSASN